MSELTTPDQSRTANAPADERMLRDLRFGLSRAQKEIPPTYFYDAKGSALFDLITRLPEYYLTRAERALLERHSASIADAVRSRSLVELGAGSADKSRILIRALRARKACDTYVPVDVDPVTLAATEAALRLEFPGLEVAPVIADMRFAYVLPPATPRPILCAFLGSTIGNFAPAEAQQLLLRLREQIGADGWILLGVDLVKDAKTLERAYNDAEGVTAEFNINVLSVLNRELGAEFEPAMFQHRAFYDPRLRRIEMHLVSRAQQRIAIPAIGEVELAEGETIRTEISCKYDRASAEEMLSAAGLSLQHWMEAADGSFALALAAAATARRQAVD